VPLLPSRAARGQPPARRARTGRSNRRPGPTAGVLGGRGDGRRRGWRVGGRGRGHGCVNRRTHRRRQSRRDVAGGRGGYRGRGSRDPAHDRRPVPRPSRTCALRRSPPARVGGLDESVR
jgi:hypothetical protein